MEMRVTQDLGNKLYNEDIWPVPMDKPSNPFLGIGGIYIPFEQIPFDSESIDLNERIYSEHGDILIKDLGGYTFCGWMSEERDFLAKWFCRWYTNEEFYRLILPSLIHISLSAQNIQEKDKEFFCDFIEERFKDKVWVESLKEFLKSAITTGSTSSTVLLKKPELKIKKD